MDGMDGTDRGSIRDPAPHPHPLPSFHPPLPPARHVARKKVDSPPVFCCVASLGLMYNINTTNLYYYKM
jgi:hypothetical protein